MLSQEDACQDIFYVALVPVLFNTNDKGYGRVKNLCFHWSKCCMQC